MGKALYRQYRSTSFDEVIGQEHITTTLKNSVAKQSIAHAYLLSGPRGVGKTSIARIFAHAVNDLPYTATENHLDIIEIDAASNRRIDEIRSLRERVHIAPVSAQYKVYIIDEVHMLTKEAFNALLKTLEEPPAHVIFILATTDAHKLPDTIVSRCIQFTFKPISTDAIIGHLARIAAAEDISIDNEALALLAEHGDGSFRDSISLLDQVKDSREEIRADDVRQALGLAPETVIAKLLEAIRTTDPHALNQYLVEAYNAGTHELQLTKQLAAYVRNGLVEAQSMLPPLVATALLENLLTVPASPKPRDSLELVLLKALFSIKDTDQWQQSSQSSPKQPSAPKPRDAKHTSSESNTSNSASKAAPAETIKDVTPQFEEPKLPERVKAVVDEPPTAVNNLQPGQDVWPQVLKKLKTQNNTLYSIARMAKTASNDGEIQMGFSFPFHYKQINQPKNKAILMAVLEELGQKNVTLTIQLVEDGAEQNNIPSNKPSAPPPVEAAEASSDATLENITNIFGTSEVLES